MGHTIGIVDDEKLVLFGIQSLFSDGDSPYSVCGTWSNGTEALSFCRKTPPDLLLTDIGMPGMDGLELIRRLKAEQVPTKIVVLSCHDEFKLVHEAFLLGADDYLLKKDIDRDRVHEILARLIPGNPVNSMKKRPDFEGFAACETGTPGLLGVMKFKKEYDGTGRELHWQPDTEMVLHVIQDAMDPEGQCFLDAERNPVVILASEDRSVQGLSVDPRMERVRAAVSRYLNRRVYLSQVQIREKDDLQELHNAGLRLLDAMFYAPGSTVLTEGCSGSLISGSFILPLSSRHLEERWQTPLLEFVSLLRRDRPDPASVKAECIFAIKHLLYHLKEYGMADPETDGSAVIKAYARALNDLDDLESFTVWLTKFLTELSSGISTGYREMAPIPEIRYFIEESLNQDLRLSVVAEKFSLNPNYLSALFKRETGQNFIEYINGKRIDLARKLLESSDLSAKEISYRCGYQNPNYFSRVFKAVVGRTISEYRDNPVICEPSGRE